MGVLWDFIVECVKPIIALSIMIGMHCLLDIVYTKFQNRMNRQTQVAFMICSSATLWSSVALFLTMVAVFTIVMGEHLLKKLDFFGFSASKEPPAP
jgi:hypothetical protein